MNKYTKEAIVVFLTLPIKIFSPWFCFLLLFIVGWSQTLIASIVFSPTIVLQNLLSYENYLFQNQFTPKILIFDKTHLRFVVVGFNRKKQQLNFSKIMLL